MSVTARSLSLVCKGSADKASGEIGTGGLPRSGHHSTASPPGDGNARQEAPPATWGYSPAMTVAGRRTVGGMGRDLLGIVASLCGLIALPFLFGAIFLGLVSVGFLGGWEGNAGATGPADLGFCAPAARGPHLAEVPVCDRRAFQILLLVDEGDNVLWRAESDEPVRMSQFFVGMAPAGFTDRSPLQGPLDPAKTYTVVGLPREVENPGELSLTQALRELNDGAEGSFAPGDLAADDVLVDGKTQSQEEFDSSCD